MAIVALHLGDPTLATDVHDIKRPDPTQQTVFIHDVFPIWHGNLSQLASTMQEVKEASLRAGICLSLGKLTKLGGARQTWADLMTKWYLEAPASGTHSAAGWALRQWKMKLPKIAASTTSPANRNWKVTPHGFTMVRIPAGQFEREIGANIKPTKQKVKLTRDFWLSNVEVSVGLFQQFIDDKTYEGLKPTSWKGVRKAISPTPQHPAQQVSWEDAVMFCNWLSWRQKLQPCYKIERLAKASMRTTLDVKTLPAGTGYRLPTEAEWEYACRASSTTDFCFGNDVKRLEGYAVFSSTKTEVLGGRICNRWGLFDMHGNINEWCYDWYGELAVDALDPMGPSKSKDSLRITRGGNWYTPRARTCQSGDRSRYYPGNRYYFFGFRVAQGPLVKK